MIQEYLNSVDKFIIIGDRVLIKPREMETHTKSGLVLPATVKEKEEIQSGYIIKRWNRFKEGFRFLVRYQQL